MNCTDFEQLIALSAGGDELSRHEARELDAHLAQCSACGNLASAMAEDLEWLRGAHLAPADRTSLLEVRSAVMQQLERNAGRWRGPWISIPWKWRIVAVTAVATLLIGAMSWWRASTNISVEQRQVAEKKAPPPPAPVEMKREPEEKKAVAEVKKPVEPRKVRKAEPAPMELVRVKLDEKPDEEPIETVMVKIPTRNPDIIVYWVMDDSDGGD